MLMPAIVMFCPEKGGQDYSSYGEYKSNAFLNVYSAWSSGVYSLESVGITLLLNAFTMQPKELAVHGS